MSERIMGWDWEAEGEYLGQIPEKMVPTIHWLFSENKRLKSEVKLLENDLFKQAFCAALPCFIDGNLDIDKPINAKINVEQAILHAQEAVRQVGDLHKELARDS